MKIVLDTNCLINVIMPGSYNNDIWQAFRDNKYVLCVTNEILFEYHEILSKRKNKKKQRKTENKKNPFLPARSVQNFH